MCLCWNFNEKGNVTGMCSVTELARRIHDPDFRPELKAAKNSLHEEREARKKAHFDSLSESRKEELRQDWLKTIKR